MNDFLQLLDSQESMSEAFPLIGGKLVGIEIIGILLNTLDHLDLEEDAVLGHDMVGIPEAGCSRC